MLAVVVPFDSESTKSSTVLPGAALPAAVTVPVEFQL
jgi:hypothetical protein